jgi:hypothetical protein
MADKTRSSTAANGDGPRQGWRTVLPPAQWLAAYWPQWLEYHPRTASTVTCSEGYATR